MLDLAGYDSSDDEVEQQAPSPRLQVSPVPSLNTLEN